MEQHHGRHSPRQYKKKGTKIKGLRLCFNKDMVCRLILKNRERKKGGSGTVLRLTSASVPVLSLGHIPIIIGKSVLAVRRTGGGYQVSALGGVRTRHRGRKTGLAIALNLFHVRGWIFLSEPLDFQFCHNIQQQRVILHPPQGILWVIPITDLESESKSKGALLFSAKIPKSRRTNTSSFD